MRIGKYNISITRERRVHPLGEIEFDKLRCFAASEVKPFARVDVMSALSMITTRMHNIEYCSGIDYIYMRELFIFLKKNNDVIFQKIFSYGSIAINSESLTICRDTDTSGVVRFVDPFYKNNGVSRLQYLAPTIEMLDTINNSDYNLLRNYGAMGIVSPENNGEIDGYLDDEDRTKIQEDYRTKYGTTSGRWSLLISQRPLKYQAIGLPIAELQLQEKRRSAIASILQFCNIPKELHAMFESVKYANRNEAELDMYSNTISAWAAMYVDIARAIYGDYIQRHPEYLPTDIWYDIVGVSALEDAKLSERQAAREELKLWLELEARMPARADYIEKRIDNLIDRI